MDSTRQETSEAEDGAPFEQNSDIPPAQGGAAPPEPTAPQAHSPQQWSGVYHFVLPPMFGPMPQPHQQPPPNMDLNGLVSSMLTNVVGPLFGAFGNGNAPFGPNAANGNLPFDHAMQHAMNVSAGPSGAPPASRAVVSRLPFVTVNHAGECAVCQESYGRGEVTRQLPCGHCFHGECILPWLSRHNNCPTCRLELETDDPEYNLRHRTNMAPNQLGGAADTQFSITPVVCGFQVMNGCPCRVQDPRLFRLAICGCAVHLECLRAWLPLIGSVTGTLDRCPICRAGGTVDVETLGDPVLDPISPVAREGDAALNEILDASLLELESDILTRPRTGPQYSGPTFSPIPPPQSPHQPSSPQQHVSAEDEPSPAIIGDPDTSCLQLRLPGGASVLRRWHKGERVAVVLDWVRANGGVGTDAAFDVVEGVPRRSLVREVSSEATLESAGLHPTAVLFVVVLSPTILPTD